MRSQYRDIGFADGYEKKSCSCSKAVEQPRGASAHTEYGACLRCNRLLEAAYKKRKRLIKFIVLFVILCLSLFAILIKTELGDEEQTELHNARKVSSVSRHLLSYVTEHRPRKELQRDELSLNWTEPRSLNAAKLRDSENEVEVQYKLL